MSEKNRLEEMDDAVDEWSGQNNNLKLINARIAAIEAGIGNLLMSLCCRVVRLEAWRDGEEIGGGDSSEGPTEHEREVIYRALEADYIEHNVPENIEEMDVDLLRLKKIAGL